MPGKSDIDSLSRKACFQIGFQVESTLDIISHALRTIQERFQAEPEWLTLPNRNTLEIMNKELIVSMRSSIYNHVGFIVGYLEKTDCGFSPKSIDKVKNYVANIKSSLDRNNYAAVDQTLNELRSKFSLATKNLE